MTFDYPWVLFLLVLPIGLLVWDWRKAPSRAGLLLKVAAFLAIILALSSPRVDVDANKVATVLLVDTSASLSQSDLQRASKLVTDIEAERGRHWLRVIPFARSSRDVDAYEKNKRWALKHSGG